MVDRKEFIKTIEEILRKYKIIDDNDFLGFRNNIKDYVIELNEVDLRHEYLKKELFHDLVEFQKDFGFSKDIFNEYIMIKNKSNKDLGQHFTPPCLNELISESTISYSEKNDMYIFYEPAGGSGSTILAGIEKFQKTYPMTEWNKCLVIHQDMDLINCTFAVLNYAMRGINSFVLCGDTLHNEVICAFQTINYNEFGLNFANISHFNNKDEITRLKNILK